MSNYQTILLAADLSDEATEIAERAKSIRDSNNATLHIVHVIEPLSFAYGGDIPMDFTDIQDEIEKQSKMQLQSLGNTLGVGEEQQHILLGRPESEIHQLADQLNADLIVVGSHGRHGLALLLGSTANGVLHGANCDVLAVRVDKAD
jgi:universal stress protein A